MGYDFIEEIRRRFGDKIGTGSKFYDVNNYSSTLSHSGDEIIPWYEEMKAEYGSDFEALYRKQAPFVSADAKWGFKRYRNIYDNSSAENLFEKTATDVVLESRLRFIKESLQGIDIVPQSFVYDSYGTGSLEARGINGEGISFARKLRGAGDAESLSVGVSGDKKGMTIVNSSSFYSRRHVFGSGYDVIEENLLSTCDASGFVFANDGLYLFEKKLVQKGEHYSPCFEVSFYDADTLNFLKNMSADTPEVVALQNMLNGNGAYFTALKDSLDTCGMVPSEVTSIECSHYDVVDFANAVYQNPELFLAEYKKKSGLTL